MNLKDYHDTIDALYNGVWTLGWEKFQKAHDIPKLIATLDSFVPVETNKKSKIKLFKAVPELNQQPTVCEWSYVDDNGDWCLTNSSWWPRNNGRPFVQNLPLANTFWNDIMVIDSAKIGYYGKKDRLRFTSAKFGATYGMMVRHFDDFATEMTRGVLIGNFTFTRHGSSLDLKKQRFNRP